MSRTQDKTQVKTQDAYEAKCRKMEEKIKELLFINAALETEVSQTRLRVKRARSDRQILLHKLLEYEAREDKASENKILNGMLAKKVTPKSDKPLVSPRSTSSKKKKTNRETTS